MPPPPEYVKIRYHKLKERAPAPTFPTSNLEPQTVFRMITQNIGFIGAGQMARALARGFVSAGLVTAEQIVASDPLEAGRKGFAEQTPGARLVASNAQVALATDVLFLAVKPQKIQDALASLRSEVGERHLIISIAAGVPLARIRTGLGSGPRLVRVMPNTPAMVGLSVSGYCLDESATDADDALVSELLGSVGTAYRLDEPLLDAVTGLAGSGPAFIYEVIAALAEGGKRMGLPHRIALEMATQTVRGAAETVQQTGESTDTLRDRVSSPGGTTLAGLRKLEEQDLRATLIAAVEAATRRSQELGQD